jgi:hypothetical protein
LALVVAERSTKPGRKINTVTSLAHRVRKGADLMNAVKAPKIPFDPNAERAAFALMDRRYWPRQFDELENDRTTVTWFNEPLLPDNVTTLVPRQRSLHAVLVENLNSTQALLTRLESGPCMRATAGTARGCSIVVRDHTASGEGAGSGARARRIRIIRYGWRVWRRMLVGTQVGNAFCCSAR